MPTFIDIHHGMAGITQEGLAEAHAEDLALQAEEGVTFERAWADPVSGTVVCLASGPSLEAVKRVHIHAGHPADEIYEVPLEV
jgi:hypothetical protein